MNGIPIDKTGKYEKYDKVRIKAILAKYKTDKALFNWCEEYKAWIESMIYRNVTMYINYCHQKSYDDDSSPFDYSEYDNQRSDSITPEQVRERLAYSNKSYTKKQITKIVTDKEQEYQDVVAELMDEIEVYEWYAVDDRLAYHLEQEHEIVVDGFWGRQCCGQSISLDNVIIQIYVKILTEILK
jgi:hypothetical protein